MLGKILGAIVGEKLAGRNRGAKGALLGVAGARIASRGLGRLGTLALAGYGAKKLYDWNKARRAGTVYPADATPR